MEEGSDSVMGIFMLGVLALSVGFGMYHGATEYDMHWFFGIICGGFVGALLGFIIMLIMSFFAWNPSSK